MKTTGNTILITGGGSGIGRAFAEAFHTLGNQVVIAGRRQKNLDEVTAANPGMKAATLDIADPAAIKAFGEKVTRDFPTLNVVLNNAGIMKPEDVKAGDVATAEAEVTTNLLGPIRLTAALLPHLLKQPAATVMTVSSGLAFTPLAMTPTYCATKAAIHSYSMSLRYQLRGTHVGVVEIVPPYVQTELMGEHQLADPRAMPLKEYIDETMRLLQTQPDAREILVERIKQRFVAGTDGAEEAFVKMNDAFASH